MSYRNSYSRQDGGGGHRGRRNHYDNNSSHRTNDYAYANYNRSHNLTEEEEKLVNLGRSDLFEKEFRFPLCTVLKDHTQITEQLFRTPRWTISDLMIFKSQLNITRDKMNDKDRKIWQEHTYKTNMTGKIAFSLRKQFNIEMCTNAWIKMAEIYARYPGLIPPSSNEMRKQSETNRPIFQSIHLCEAPGAFICATNYYLRKRFQQTVDWQWTGLSLNPYYEGNDTAAMIDDDRFIVETIKNWYFGVDNSGNILKPENIRGLWNIYAGSNKVTLVTSDGAVDASGDPNEQEALVSELHYTEAVAAMGALKEKGSFVLKMFNLFECESVCLLYILSLHFNELYVFKPASSRTVNAEVYIICIGFRGISDNVLQHLLSYISPSFPKGLAMLPQDSIPLSFLESLIICAEKFTKKQIEAIERNLELEHVMNYNVAKALERLAYDVKDQFINICSIISLSSGFRIVNHLELDGSAKHLGNSASLVRGGLRQRLGGTLEDRMKKTEDRKEFLSGVTASNTSGKRKLDEKDEDNLPATKKRQVAEIDNSIKAMSIGEKLMKKAGYVEGRGLGVAEQGRTQPIEVSLQDNRAGLGRHKKGTTTGDTLVAVDEPFFIDFDHSPARSRTSKEMKVLGIDQKSIVGVADKIQAVIASIFVSAEDLETLYRKRLEAYEQGRIPFQKHLFLSENLDLLNDPRFSYPQTAVQLASVDAILKVVSGLKLAKDGSPLSFIVDDPGFAEYINWQQTGNVRGFVFTEQHHVFQTARNRQIECCNSDTEIHQKVVFMSADVSVPYETVVKTHYVEYENKQKFARVCQQVFKLLDRSGNFVCKLLDLFTRFTADLVYLLYKCFRSITIIKPFTLNPACSDRFLVCQDFLGSDELRGVEKHLDDVVTQLSMENDVVEILPISCLLEKEFQQYLVDTAQRLLQREIQTLKKLLADGSEVSSIGEKHLDEAKKLIFCNERRTVPPDDEPVLPDGWIKQWSKREENFYYFNVNTASTTTKLPQCYNDISGIFLRKFTHPNTGGYSLLFYFPLNGVLQVDSDEKRYANQYYGK
ncbi:unnamed protein product [Didymodactylos carnosus]|uniref:Cap-specific mRNA (nucleoside-2'-O-)-methyltransferase 1 n=1 Tax=Didymodactylos carnosus TaxID=1234261 RepID=A0A814ZK06_9BILA|nr:unnamed protein product [Didymodactylos carnosus]CAF4010217.1 unnamed protein product [Didymodactylos carnosus]